MEWLQKAAVLTRLVDRLRDKGSRCGATRVQKSTLYLQELMKVPLGFNFTMYKHGPFSFDLRDELSNLEIDNLLKTEPVWPHGTDIVVSDQGRYIQGTRRKTLARFESRIGFVADTLGGRAVGDLEQLSTAFFVNLHKSRYQLSPSASVDERARKLAELKPHISIQSAKSAIEEHRAIAISEAAGLYRLLAERIGQEHQRQKAATLFQKFVKASAEIYISKREIIVGFGRRSYNPVLAEA